MTEKTPGVGAYNLAKGRVNDKSDSLAKINETLRNCRDKAIVAAEKGQLPKHVEEVHAKFAQAQERVVELEILKLGWDKQRELTEKEKDDLKRKLAKLDTIQEKCKKAENDRQELEKQVNSHLHKMQSLEQQEHQLQLKVIEAEKKKEGNEKEKLKLISELDKLRINCTEVETISKKQKDEISNMKKDLFSLHNELASTKEECHSLKFKQEKKAQEFQNERRTLTFQIESLNLKCAEWDDRIKMSSEASAKEIGALLEANLQKVSEIEEKKKALENLESQYEEDMKQMKVQEKMLKEQLIKLEKTQVQLEKDSAILVQDLSHCKDEKKKLETENIVLTRKLEEALNETKKYSQHLVDIEKQLEDSVHQYDILKLEKEKEAQNFQKEKQAFTSNVESLNFKYEALEENFRIASEKHSLEIEALQEVNAEQIVEIRDKNKDLVSQAESGRMQMQSQLEALQLKLVTLEEAHDKIKKESSVIAQDLTNKLAICEEDKKRLESEIIELTVKLEHTSEELEELTHHLIFTQDKLQDSMNDIEKLKQTHENEMQEFENDRQFLNSQVQSFILKCEELEDKVRETTQASAREVESVRERNSRKLCAMEEKNKKLEDLVKQVENDKKQIQTEEHQLREKLKMLENAQNHLERESSALVQDLSTQLISSEENSKTLVMENDDLIQKLEEALEKVDKMERENILALERAKDSYSEGLAKVKTEYTNSSQRQAQLWTEKQSSLEEENRQLQARYSEIMIENERLGQHLSQKEQENVDIGQKLENATEKIETMEKENSLAVEEAKSIFTEKLAKVEKENVKIHQEQVQAWQENCSSLEQEKEQLVSKVCLLEKEKSQLQDMCDANNELFHDLSQKEMELASLKEKSSCFLQDQKDLENHLSAADQEIEGLNNIISEMSEKIEQMECEKAEILSEFDDDWKGKYEDLVKRMEPFKEILDGFELERQLLHEKDKFTSEQLEKLTQECIKNMGHQNHKQRIKYLDKIKQENLGMSKTIHELREQNQRLEANLKKLREKTVDKAESNRKPWQRGPLKEGNHL